MNPFYMPDHIFKAAVEAQSLTPLRTYITPEQFCFNAQRVVDHGRWRGWGSAWAREVQIWVDAGFVSL